MLNRDDRKIQLLIRSVKSEQFHLIVIEYNHHDIIYQVKKIINESFPDRSASSITVNKKGYSNVMSSIYKQTDGFLYIDDFENVINNPEIYVGFNQRRDKLTSYPIQLICFLPYSQQLIQDFSRHMPDLWSLRNLSIELSIPLDFSKIRPLQNVSSLGGRTTIQKKEELDTICAQISGTHIMPSNMSLLDNLFSQAFLLCQDLNLYNKGLTLVREWNSIFNDLTNENYTQNKANTLYWEAVFLLELEKVSASINSLQRALALIGDDSEDLFIVKSKLGQAYTANGENELAIKIFEEILNYKILISKNDYRIITTKIALAIAYGAVNKYDKASNLLSDILNNNEYIKDRTSGEIIQMNSIFSSYLFALGKYDEAENVLETTLNQSEDILGENHNNTNIIRNQLATVYTVLDKYDRAIELLQKCYDIAVINLGSNNVTTIAYKVQLLKTTIDHDMYTLSYISSNLESTDYAIYLNKEDVNISYLRVLIDLVDILIILDHSHEAIEILKFIDDNSNKAQNLEFRLFVKIKLGEAYYMIGNKSLAFKLVDEAYHNCLKHLGADHKSTIRSESILGLIYYKFSAYNKAKLYTGNAFKKAKNIYFEEDKDLLILEFNYIYTTLNFLKLKDQIETLEVVVSKFNELYGIKSMYSFDVKLKLIEFYILDKQYQKAKELLDSVYSTIKLKLDNTGSYLVEKAERFYQNLDMFFSQS